MTAREYIQGVLRRRSWAYRACFLDEATQKPSVAGERVLADLAKFCRAKNSTAIVSPIRQMIDPLGMAMAEGRREVWLRIQQYLALEANEIQRLRETSEDQQAM